MSSLEKTVTEHATSRAAAHAGHAMTKVRMAMRQETGGGASREPHQGSVRPSVDWGEDGPRPWLKEPQIMQSSGGVADYQSGLLGRAWYTLLATS